MIIGVFKDMTGQYDSAFYIAGATTLISAFAFLTTEIRNYRKDMKSASKDPMA